MAAARAAYEQQGAADKLQLYVVPGCNHECTACMWEQVRVAWRGGVEAEGQAWGVLKRTGALLAGD